MQLSLFANPKFPKTRYQGSKYKLVPWLTDVLQRLDFDTALDAFGGTGAVSYALKSLGKKVTYNDVLRFNYLVGKALIQNSSVRLDPGDVEFLLARDPNFVYESFIADTFKGIYYLDAENEWLDVVTQNIMRFDDALKQALAYWALFQAAIIKRPYNLFHRRNLYVRTADVERSFGNKTTWDKPFEHHFARFVKQANRAVFDNGRRNEALNMDVFDLEVDADLVYIDTPYIPAKGSLTDYFGFYHFLEGLSLYEQWPDLVDYGSKHRRLKPINDPWIDKRKVLELFDRLFEKFGATQMVVSYRSDGIPSINELVNSLRRHGRKPRLENIPYQYALSKKRAHEVIIHVD